MKYIITIMLTLALFSSAEEKSIKQFELNHQQVYKLLIAPEDKGVTTVMFPSEITAIYGAQVSGVTGKQNLPFIMSHQEGTHFFTIKSSKKTGEKGAINVIWNNRVYVIRLDVSTLDNAYSSVTFTPAKAPVHGVALSNEVAPNVILALLDKAKSYHLLKKHYPNQMAGITHKIHNTRLVYSLMDIKLLEAVRFDEYDTIVFHCLLENKTDSTLSYSPNDFAVNIGNLTLKAKVSDASGKLAPKSKDRIYFAIQGGKNNMRNNIAVNNKFVVLLPVSEMPTWRAEPEPAKIEKAEPAMKKTVEEK